MKTKNKVDYYQKEAFSSSLARAMLLVSPQRAVLPVAATPAMRLGTAVHAEILRPLGAERLFAYQASLGEPDGIGQEDVESVEGCVKALRDTESVNLLWEDALFESEVFWTDVDGLECKAKIDLMQPRGKNVYYIVDVKTTSRCKTPEDVENYIFNYKLHVQAAHYCDAVCARNINSWTGQLYFVFIFVQTTPPYEVWVMFLGDHIISSGHTLLAVAKRRFKEYKRNGINRGVSYEVKESSRHKYSNKLLLGQIK